MTNVKVEFGLCTHPAGLRDFHDGDRLSKCPLHLDCELFVAYDEHHIYLRGEFSILHLKKRATGFLKLTLKCFNAGLYKRIFLFPRDCRKRRGCIYNYSGAAAYRRHSVYTFTAKGA